MSNFVKSIVKLAKKYRASEYDARFFTYIAKDEHSGGGYTKLKKVVFEKFLQNNPNIMTKYGISEAVGTGLQIHHMIKEPHFIERNHVSGYYTELIKYINGEKEQEIPEDKDLKGVSHEIIMQQIANIVFIPKWLHMRCKNHKHRQPLTSVGDYYNLLNKYLTNIRWFRKIKQLKFDKTSIHSAAVSIETLAVTADGKNKEIILEKLEKVHTDIAKGMMEQLKEQTTNL